MTETNSHPPTVLDTRTRNAFWVSVATALIMLAIMVYSLLALGPPTWWLDEIVLAGIVAIAASLSVWFSRRGRPNLGIWLILATLFFAFGVVVYQFENLGLVLGIFLVVATYALTSPTLSQGQVNNANTLSVLMAAVMILLDLLQPFERQVAEISLLTIWVIIGVFTLVYAVLIVVSYRSFNLRAKLRIAFIVFVLVVVSALTYFWQFTTTQILTEHQGGELHKVAETRAVRIGGLLNEQINLLTALSLDEVLKESIQDQNKAYTGSPAEILADIEEKDLQWRAADEVGNNYVYIVRQHLSNAVALSLHEYQGSFPNNAEVFVTDRYGALVGATNRTSDYYQADEEWWQVAYSDGSGDIYISQPEYDESVGEFSVLLVIPMRDQDTGEVVGILRTTYLMSALSDILLEPVGETGAAEIVFPGSPTLQIRQGELATMETDVYEKLQAAFRQLYLKIDYLGESSVVSLADVATLEGDSQIDELGWFVFIHQSTAELLAPIQERTRDLYLVVFVIMIVAVISATGLANLLVAPLTQFTDVAERIAAGDFEVFSKVTSDDEYGTLATTFNDMKDQLQNTLAEMEQRITDRTRDLELAAEVSQRLALVRDPDVLFTEAVELIGDRFDLYYTQIYLVGPTGRSLHMRAGTGDVGQTLLRQGHRLPVDLGSLNGTAVVEKRPVIVSDTETSIIHRPNPLLPDTRSEMVVPLIAGERVVGALDMQSAQPKALSEDNLTAFEVLAGQLAITIVNTELFVQGEQARQEVEQQARRLTHTGWQEFLNAVDRAEKIAFSYNQGAISELPDPSMDIDAKEAIISPILISGETVGAFQFEREEPLTENEDQMVTAVAQQVSQQIENLRLLAQSEQYRAESQDVLRRLTREGWQDFQDQAGLAEKGFVYQNNQVSPLDGNQLDGKNLLAFDIRVRDEVIGEMGIMDISAISEEDDEFMQTVSSQLSSHLENLRLTQQTEQALAVSQLSEERFRTIVENAPEAIIVVDVDTGLFLDPNENALALYGLDEEEILKVGLVDMSPAEQPNGRHSEEIVPEFIDAALLGEAPVVEWVHRNAAGENIDCEIRLVRMPDPTRQLVRASVVDIRERKEAELALREAQERAQTILESVSLPMMITRLSDDVLTFVNQPAEEVVRLNPDEVINQPAPPFFYNLEDENEFLAELQKEGFVSNMQLQILRTDGEPFWALISARAFTYQGEASILKTFSDITERIKAQEAVTKRAAELATVAEVGTTVSTLLDPQMMLQTVVDLTKERFELYHAHIYMLDETEQKLELVAGAGDVGQTMVAEGWQIELDAKQSLVAQVARERRGVIVNDVRTEPGFMANPLLPDTRAELAVPLVVGDRLLGVLDVQSSVVGQFSEEDISIQTTLASQIAVALQNARTYAQTQRQAEHESLINVISQRIQSTTSVENALQVTIRELGRALGAKRTSVQLGLPQKQELTKE